MSDTSGPMYCGVCGKAASCLTTFSPGGDGVARCNECVQKMSEGTSDTHYIAALEAENAALKKLIDDARGDSLMGLAFSHALSDREVVMVDAWVQRTFRAETENAKLKNEPRLGMATTAELLEELTARAEVGGYATYRTWDGEEHDAKKTVEIDMVRGKR